MEDAHSSRCSLLIFLIISGVLSFVNAIEFYNFIAHWNGGLVIFSPLFEECIRFELIMKSVFSFFSLFASFSAFLVTSLLIINTNFFIEKLSPSFLNCNYFIFGPGLLAFSLLGIFNIDSIMYSCDKNNVDYNNKVFSFSNFIAVVFCFIISLVLTVIIEFFNSVTIFIDSILRKSSGNAMLGNAFWFYVGKYRGRNLRSYNNNNNENNNQNINNNANQLNNSNENTNNRDQLNNVNNNFNNRNNLRNDETNTLLNVRLDEVQFSNNNNNASNRNEIFVISHNENLSFDRTICNYCDFGLRNNLNKTAAAAEDNLALENIGDFIYTDETAIMNVNKNCYRSNNKNKENIHELLKEELESKQIF